MSVELLFGLFTIIVSALGAVAWYFIDAWIRSVDSKLADQKEAIKEARLSINRIPTYSPEAMASKVTDQIRKQNLFPLKKIDQLHEDMVLIKETLSTKVLPAMDRVGDLKGKLIIIEDRVTEQDKKIVTIVNHLTKRKG
jgi:hypothetical protein